MTKHLAWTSATILFSTAFAAWLYLTPTPVEPIPEIPTAVLSELLDRRHAATLLQREAYTEKVVLPASSIDLSIDRRLLLATLFSVVTKGQPTDQLRVEKWVRYVQDRIAHPLWPPIIDNGQAIYDPYWILKNRIGHCGQTNRVVVDGLIAAGFKARVVQLKAHVAAEVWLDGAWRFLDAHWLDFGQFVRRADGSLPSAREIHENPALLYGLTPGLEFKLYPVDVVTPGSEPYEAMFSTAPYYYVKTATAEQENNEYFGWNYYETVHE